MRLTDAQILTHAFQVAQERADDKTRQTLQDHIDYLRVAPDDQEVIDMCLDYYSQIHYLIKSK